MLLALPILFAVEQIPVIQIGVIVLLSLILGILFTKMGQSSSLGYILAGIILGPLATGYLSSEIGLEISSFLGEIGVMMLLFYLGLELSIKKFKETGAVATILAFAEMLFAFLAGFFIAKMFGFSNEAALIIGAMLTATSTVIVSKFMLERGIINTPEARVVLSILILEDFFALLVLVFITSAVSNQALDIVVLNAVIFVIAMFFLVSKISKHVLNLLHSIGQSDQMWLYGIGVFLFVSYFGSTYLGLTPAIGAYFAGFALAESVYGERIKNELGLFKEFFILFFFVSFGTSIALPQSSIIFVILIALTISLIIAKMLAHGILGTAIGMEMKSALTGGTLLVPVGEFSMIIAAAAAKMLPNPADVLSLGFMLVVVTTSIMPLLFSKKDSIAELLSKVYPLQLQEKSRILQKRLNALEALSKDPTLNNEYVVSVGNLLKNFVIAVSIVYLSYLISFDISLPSIGTVSSSFLIIPLIAWPIYLSISELRFLTKRVTNSLLSKSFPAATENVAEIERFASDIFTGMLLVLVGAGATIYFDFSSYGLPFLLVSGTYTLIALLYFLKSFYSLIDQYGLLEGAVLSSADEHRHNKRFYELSKEFNEHSQYFRDLYSARAQAKEKIQGNGRGKGTKTKIAIGKMVKMALQRKKQEEESFLKSKEDAVNEKIKRREKLTTEDLLVFQKFGKG